MADSKKQDTKDDASEDEEIVEEFMGEDWVRTGSGAGLTYGMGFVKDLARRDLTKKLH